MTDEEIDAFLDLLRAAGWSVEAGGGGGLSEAFRRRYPRIPDDYERFLRRVASCANADETVWFLCAGDYDAPGAGEGFAWNEFELSGLGAARGDARAEARVRDFWDRHLPFLMSVSGDYAYLAFRVTGDDFGSVVDGYDVDFQGVTDVAPDFAAFARAYSAALRGEGDDSIPPEYF